MGDPGLPPQYPTGIKSHVYLISPSVLSMLPKDFQPNISNTRFIHWSDMRCYTPTYAHHHPSTMLVQKYKLHLLSLISSWCIFKKVKNVPRISVSHSAFTAREKQKLKEDDNWSQMNNGLVTPKDCKIISENCCNSKTVAATAWDLRLRYNFMQKQKLECLCICFHVSERWWGWRPLAGQGCQKCPCYL